MTKEVEQEQEDFEIVNLMDEDPSDEPTERGYEYYARKAEQEAAKQAGESDDDKSGVDDDDSKVPDKFRGKSASDIIESYLKLESEYGRKNNEVGQLRKLTDQLLELNDPDKTSKAQERKRVDVDTLLEDPDSAINDAVENNPKVREILEREEKSRIKAEKAVFEEAHPDWEATLATPEFAEWVQGSPVRHRMLMEADKNYDYVTGKELFDMYELAHGQARKEAVEERNTNARKSAKQAVTESGGDRGNRRTKKFRRADLIQLKLTNPAKYERMRDEINAAYANGDVI